MPVDKGLKILKDFYRSRDEQFTEEQTADFELAKAEGYMFDFPARITHDEAMERLADALSIITPEMVGNAFLYSLSTRRLEYRSALSSYYAAIAIPPHEFSPNQYCDCEVCGWRKWKTPPQEGGLKYLLDMQYAPNYFNYLRYQFGGCSDMRLNFALFDLEQFLKLPAVTPCAEDREILKRILGCVKTLEWRDRVAKLKKAAIHEKILKTNSYEMEMLLTALGVCGVLTDRKAPALDEKFVGYWDIKRLQFSEWGYPINMWRAYNGVNKERLIKVFGSEWEDF